MSTLARSRAARGGAFPALRAPTKLPFYCAEACGRALVHRARLPRQATARLPSLTGDGKVRSDIIR